MSEPFRLPPPGTKERQAYRARVRRSARRVGVLTPDSRVPVDEARTVLRKLRDAGFTYRRMGELVDIDSRNLPRYLRHSTKTISKDLHDRITSINLGEVLRTAPRRHQYALAAPYRDRLRQYMAAGWGRRELSELCGPPLYTNHTVWRSETHWVTSETAAALDRLFAKLGDRVAPEPNTRTMTRLRTLGYGPPAAYEGGELADPSVLERSA